MILQDLHVHTIWSDGKDTPAAVAAAACERGVRRLGFSDHVYAPYDEACCMKKGAAADYRREIYSLRDQYRGRMEILCGIEQDLFSPEPTEGYDYVIGAVHYLKTDIGYLSVDWKKEFLLEAADRLGDIFGAAELYYAQLSRLAEIPGCSLIAHFDLFRKLNGEGELFDPAHPRYRNAWQRAADRLLLMNIPFEINTGAISRGYQKDPYPSDEIIAYLHQRGARFVLSSDSHQKETLMYDFERQESMAREKGLRLLEVYPS